jgi:protein TonB
MIFCSFFGHLFLFGFMTLAYSGAVERVEVPQIKSIKGYLISSEEILQREVKEVARRTNLSAPEFALPAPEPEPSAPAPLPKEEKKIEAVKAPEKSSSTDKRKEADRELKKKALEEIKKKISKLKALPAIPSTASSRPAPRPENFPLPKGWKESKTAREKIPLTEGDTSGLTEGEASNEIARAIARYSGLVKSQILSNFFVSYKKALKDNPSGEIVVEIDLDDTGALKSSRIVKGSGFSVLDDNCTNAIQRAAPFPPIPEVLMEENGIAFEIKFLLSELAKYISEE